VILSIAFLILTFAMGLVLVRAFSGPTVQDRVLSVNTFGTTVVLWLCAYAALNDSAFVIDIATIYALTSFIATIAMLRFIEHESRRKSRAEEPADAENG
jgi:multicomponent Na+:H+ antiporter subunit F